MLGLCNLALPALFMLPTASLHDTPLCDENECAVGCSAEPFHSAPVGESAAQLRIVRRRSLAPRGVDVLQSVCLGANNAALDCTASVFARFRRLSGLSSH